MERIPCDKQGFTVMDKNFKSGCLPPAKKSSSNKIRSQMEQQQQNNWKETYLRFIHNMEQDKTCSLFGKLVSNGKWHFFYQESSN